MSITSWQPPANFVKRTKYAHELLAGEYLSVAGVWKEIEQAVQTATHPYAPRAAGTVNIYFVGSGDWHLVRRAADLLEIAVQSK